MNDQTDEPAVESSPPEVVPGASKSQKSWTYEHRSQLRQLCFRFSKPIATLPALRRAPKGQHQRLDASRTALRRHLFHDTPGAAIRKSSILWSPPTP